MCHFQFNGCICYCHAAGLLWPVGLGKLGRLAFEGLANGFAGDAIWSDCRPLGILLLGLLMPEL